MVVVKLAVILLVLAVGVFYVDTKNWNPFAPNGVSGVLKGVSAVFFAYIGFDAISTTAEECKNPQRDLPRGMMWAIIICTILYVAIALVLTGIVNYRSKKGRKATYYYAFVYDVLSNEMIYKKQEVFKGKDTRDLVNAKAYQTLFELRNLKIKI